VTVSDAESEIDPQKNSDSIWLVLRRSWVQIPAGPGFFSVD